MPNRFQTWFAGLSQTRRFHPAWIVLAVLVTLAVAVVVWVPAELVARHDAADAGRDRAAPGAADAPAGAAPPVPAPQPGAPAGGAVRAGFTPPDPDAIPEGPFGDAVRLGRDIFIDTQTHARAYVGNGLNCVNCHLDAGRKPDAAPLWAAYGMFPMYREKNDKINTYEDRLAGCFRFSMNGKPPPYGSKELVALMSYSAWLARGAPLGVALPGRGYPTPAKPAQAPDVARGKAVYAAKCALCHGADGAGTQVDGRYAFPPLWGPDSFNGGAGMSRIENAAGFIQANMPLGQGNTLSDQEAWDVARYMNSHARPPDPRLADSRSPARGD